MADFGAELHDRIKADFERRCALDSYINAIRRKIENGKADMNDTSAYARQLGARLRQAIESNVREGDFTDGRIYFDTARSILEPLLRDNYEDINAVCEEVQRALDAKQGIGLQPQHADFPDERTRAACGGVAAAESSEKAVEVMGVTAESITKSMQVDFVQKNLDFRSQAGLDTYIERTDSSGCCSWCAALAGRYRYPDDVPRDIFRRHDNCTCDVSYVSNKGRQNVHSKKWTTPAADMAKRIEYETSVPKPMKLTAEEARAKEAEILVQRALTYSANSGIINQTEVEIERIRQEVIPNLVTDVIVPRQAIHRQGTAMYEQRRVSLEKKGQYGPSYITINDDEILELVEQYKSSGKIVFNKGGEWNRQETILSNEKIVGVVVNNLTGQTAETTVFKIHYGDDGVHIVPDYPSKKKVR